MGDAVDADEGRGVPVTAVEDSAAAAAEDSVEDMPQQRGLMIPASMGLRFQIPTDLDAFTVLATWGTYQAVADERSDAPRAPLPAHPVEVPTTVWVADLDPGATKAYVLHDKVVLMTRSSCVSTATTTLNEAAA